MRTLYVKMTSVEELEDKWGFAVPVRPGNPQLYIRCNKQGDVNWEKSLIYVADELVERQVVIVK